MFPAQLLPLTNTVKDCMKTAAFPLSEAKGDIMLSEAALPKLDRQAVALPALW